MTDWKTLAGAIAGAPSLPSAACRGRPHLFDEAAAGEPGHVVTARHAQALGLCDRCPARRACEAWFLSLPRRKRPRGVIAGRIHTPTQREAHRAVADDSPA